MDKGKMTQKEKANFILKLVGILVAGFVLLCAIAVFSPKNENDNTIKDCKLCFKVTTLENVDEDTQFDVKLIGSNKLGEPVDEKYEASLNQVYDISVKTGEYKLYVDVSSLNTGVNIFKSKEVTVSVIADTLDPVELTFELDKDAMAKAQATTNEQSKTQSQSGAGGDVVQEFVIVTTTGKFHVSTCRTLSRVKPGNKKVVQATYNQLIAQGYVPCKVCIG